MANAKIKHLQLPNGTTYDFHAVTADSATTTTTSTYLSVPRVAKDSQSLPGANKCIIEEYSSGTNYNLPSNAFYHIYSSQGSDTKYGCQLALGMTTEAAYYRVYNNQSWSSWRSIINTNTTYTLAAGTGDDANKIVLTPSSGTANKITVPYATSAGSATSATSATTASKLSTNAGSTTNPVYFTGGVPTACTYSLNKTVPSDAVFTDTNTHRPIQVNGTEILGNNTTALNLKAGSNVSITNSSGTVTIAATDTNTTYSLTADTANSKITLTPSSGTAQSITVPFATSCTNATKSNSIFCARAESNVGEREIVFATTTSSGDAYSSLRRSPKLTFDPYNSKLYVNENIQAKTIYATSEFVCGTGIELGTYENSSLSFIDFHWNTVMTGNDFTARICQRAESTVDLIGKNSSTWGIWRAGSFSTQSSIHAKENIHDITVEDSKKLLQLRPVTFNYKNGGLTDQAGLIAEEVYLVMPKMVIGDINYNPEEPWNTPSIDYSKFVPYLIKMIQEQQKEIDELRRLVQG